MASCSASDFMMAANSAVWIGASQTFRTGWNAGQRKLTLPISEEPNSVSVHVVGTSNSVNVSEITASTAGFDLRLSKGLSGTVFCMYSLSSLRRIQPWCPPFRDLVQIMPVRSASIHGNLSVIRDDVGCNTAVIDNAMNPHIGSDMLPEHVNTVEQQSRRIQGVDSFPWRRCPVRSLPVKVVDGRVRVPADWRRGH